MIVYENCDNTLKDLIKHIESFEIIINDCTKFVPFGCAKYEDIVLRLSKLFENSRLSPAFGVSLHNETLKEMKTGVWLKINFLKEFKKNGLSFNALLFALEETSGLNLIRFYNESYEGRCLFLDIFEKVDLKELV